MSINVKFVVFIPNKTYGDLRKDYIHVHHKVDLASIKKEYSVDPINDFISVCPNCHAMLHKSSPAMGYIELKTHIQLKITPL